MLAGAGHTLAARNCNSFTTVVVAVVVCCVLETLFAVLQWVLCAKLEKGTETRERFYKVIIVLFTVVKFVSSYFKSVVNGLGSISWEQ